MSQANARWMKNPGIVARARGGQPGSQANGGLKSLHPVTLAAGTVLIRFGRKDFGMAGGANGALFPAALSGSGGFAGTVASGEWWLAFDEYRKVVRFADRNRLAVNTAVRRLCFVPAEWSELGMIVQARLMQPLRAYQGLGNPATGASSTGAATTYDRRGAGAEQIRQLYIPGLAAPDLRRECLLICGTGFLPAAGD